MPHAPWINLESIRKKRKFSLFGPQGTPLGNLGHPEFWDLGGSKFRDFGAFERNFRQLGTEVASYRSYMRPRCIWSRFGKIENFHFLGPKGPPFEISNIRNFGFSGCPKFGILMLLSGIFVSLALRWPSLGHACILDAY